MEAFRPSCPGLFVTATDTEVGKTVVSCAILAALADRGVSAAACKPVASGCREVDGRRVNEDAQALGRFAGGGHPLETINPIRFVAPLAPAAAADAVGEAVDFSGLAPAVKRLTAGADLLVVEGVGGLYVPLDPADPGVTVVDLVRAFGYPALVVARPGLGTLNHTALTVAALRRAGCAVAGVVVNGGDPADAASDPSVATNRRWIERTTGVPVLAEVPRCPDVDVAAGRLPAPIREAVAAVDWTVRVGTGRLETSGGDEPRP